MKPSKTNFRHESLQDTHSIEELLKALTKGIGKGKLKLSDDDGEMVLEPEGLLSVKITASQDDNRHRLDLRISWRAEEPGSQTNALQISSDD